MQRIERNNLMLRTWLKRQLARPFAFHALLNHTRR
ncbi:hypothetical protein [Aeromonas sp. QDB12]